MGERGKESDAKERMMFLAGDGSPDCPDSHNVSHMSERLSLRQDDEEGETDFSFCHFHSPGIMK